jgi:LysR family nitrogen assimilation transcriptional regulator
MASILATPLLARTLARHPLVRPSIFESASGYVADRLVGGRLDLALLFRDSPTHGVAVQPLLDEELFVMGNVGLDDLPLDDPCPLQRLNRVPLILPSGAQGLRVLVERSFIKADVTLNVVAEVDSLTTTIGAVRKAVGCTILSKSALVSHGGEQGLVIRPLAAPGLKRPVSLCWSTDLPRTAAAMAVRGILVDLVRELIADGTWSGAQSYL